MKPFLIAVLSFFVISSGQGQNRSYPPVIEGSTEIVYKEASDTELKLWMIRPDDWKATDTRPAIVFYFGGGWRSGSPAQFEQQARHLADRGMVAFLADYRVSSRHGTKAKDCLDDARDALKYVRTHATELGVDPNRIASGGGSAGGHLAACLGTIPGSPESRADAMALFNPATVLAPIDGITPWKEDRAAELTDRMGADPKSLSPAHHVTAEAPPCIVFHGKADTTVPYATAELFTKLMTEAGVKCVLHGYEHEGHGFFNAGRRPTSGNVSAFSRTMEQLDAFLVELGWLE